MNRIDFHQQDTTQLSAQPQSLSALWRAAVGAGFPVALWRLPNGTEKELIIDGSGDVRTVAIDLDELPMGFAVSPFLNPDGQHTLFLQADWYWRFDEREKVLAEERRLAVEHPAAVRLAQHLERPQPDTVNKATVTVLPPNEGEQEAYEAVIRQAVRQMERGKFRKVVLSRTKALQFEQQPDVVALFNRLCEVYPAAFVSAIFLPEEGQVWLGATPERLVSLDAQGIFRTVSLAGTQSAYNGEGRLKRPSETHWTHKEIEEQALVSRYISDCFKKVHLREYVEEGPKTVMAGNLMHLQTDFTVDTQSANFPQLGTVMTQLLHPTSAVCGMPREAAQRFILQHETHDRELYSGYLGPVNVNGAGQGPTTNLFVNLRCLKLEGEQGTLYAGGGLTKESVPAREWRETELKCQTLLAVIE